MTVVFNPGPGDPQLCTFCHIFYLTHSDHLMSWWSESRMCSIRKTYKICRAVGPQDRFCVITFWLKKYI